MLQTIGPVPIHSFADAQFALDKASPSGTLDVAWLRGGERLSATVDLPDRWKRSDITWRASVRWRFVASLPFSGDDLPSDERRVLGLLDNQLAFRSARLKPRANEAGLQAGDVVVACDDRPLDMTAVAFRQYIRH